MRIKLVVQWTKNKGYGRVQIFEDLQPEEQKPLWHYSGTYFGVTYKVMSFVRCLWCDGDNIDVVEIKHVYKEMSSGG